VEQFVGLMLDKSKGLVLGNQTELVSLWVNFVSTFETFITNGKDITSAINTASSGYCYTNKLNMVAGAWYVLTINLTLNSGTAPLVSTGNNGTSNNLGSLLNTQTINGSNSIKFRYNGDSNDYLWFFNGAPCNWSATIELKQWVQGNHAFQTNSAKRPKLAARYNLLTYSEEFDNGAWVKTQSSVSDNTVTAPNGTLTGDTFLDANGASYAEIKQIIAASASSGNSFTASVDAAQGTRRYVYVSLGSSAIFGTDAFAIFDLQAGTVKSVGATATASISNSGNGWYRCTVNATATGSGQPTMFVYHTNAAGTSILYTGTGTGSIYLWGADLRPADQATGLIGPTYQRVAAATVYDTAGFLPYLAFDGLSWSMSTNSIDFSAGDKVTAWAGVRKLSDAAPAIISELSANYNLNNGSFLFTVSDPSTSVVAGTLEGLSRNIATFVDAAAPLTEVLSWYIDRALSSDEVVFISKNGVSQSITRTFNDNTTGNFGNYPLFIGARNNASIFFTGWLTSLIVRGAQSTQSQIEATEAWVNGKTGAY
jgi:hypothetical protein